MKTSSDGIAMLHHAESCRLTAYRDSVGVLTIGWGHTGPEVHQGLVWTQKQADEAFERRLSQEFEPAVLDAAGPDTSQSEFDAMVCWAYNVGVGAAEGSTLIRMHKAGARSQAADQFLAWKRAGGKDCSIRSNNCYGLIRRRNMERARYLGATGAEAIEIYEDTA